jgi:choline-glycine betaine transporter
MFAERENIAMIQTNFSRRTVALFWCLLIGIVIGVLIYLEQIALLYVLATLALVVLLLIVGFANLENVGRENVENLAVKEE